MIEHFVRAEIDSSGTLDIKTIYPSTKKDVSQQEKSKSEHHIGTEHGIVVSITEVLDANHDIRRKASSRIHSLPHPESMHSTVSQSGKPR